jgi:hypothetical protein
VRIDTKRRVRIQIPPQPGWFKATAVILAMAFFSLAVVPVGWAQEGTVDHERTDGTATQVGLGATSFFLTLPYGIVKVVYATLGGIIGSLTYALTAGNERAANAVWHTSLRGTYVITPEHLRGERTVRFLGVPPEDESPSPEPASEPTPPEPMK